MCDSSTDPTSSDFDPGKTLETIGTGGLNYAGEEIYEKTKEAGDWAEENLTNKEQTEAMQEQLAKQEEATKQQLAFQKEQYEQYQEQLAPYLEAGEQFLPQYMEMLTPEAQAQFKQEYLAGDEFQGIRDQATEQQLQNAAAFGGLRSSGTQDRMIRETVTLADQFSNQAYQDQLGNYMQGVNIGSGALGNKLTANNAYNQQANQAINTIGQLGLQGAALNTSPLQQWMPAIQTGAQIYGAS